MGLVVTYFLRAGCTVLRAVLNRLGLGVFFVILFGFGVFCPAFGGVLMLWWVLWGFVFWGGISACRISLARRVRHSWRLRIWSRKRSDWIITWPVFVSRRPSIGRSLFFTAGESCGQFCRSKVSCARVETLLTFWPPGPWART